MTTPTRSPSTFVSTAIPYVNARPHVGFAYELVMADAIARHRRQRGDDVCFSSGTDENSLKNVRAAEAEGIGTRALVDRNAATFRSLREHLDLSFDEFLRTSADPRHAPAVEMLWRACRQAGDIYRRQYRGLYCVGCEQFYTEDELDSGRCPEHGTEPELVEEENDFFRLSRHQAELERLLESGELRVTPEAFRNETLAFVRSGLQDFSISRSHTRARGWGIGVPDDPSQVVYVWFDALGNYVSGLGYAEGSPSFDRYWTHASRRIHVLGKGVTRFHAVYWPAILLSAGLALPTDIVVHGYLTVDGQKIGKSAGNAVDPVAIAGEHGIDPLRWFFCRHVRHGRDGDFSEARLEAVYRSELADGIGNLLQRTVGMVERYFGGRVPAPSVLGDEEQALVDLAEATPTRIDAALEEFRVDEASGAAWALVDAANLYAARRAPWVLARRSDDPEAGAQLSTTLWCLVESLRLAAIHLSPFIPSTAAAIRERLGLPEPAESNARWGGTAPGVHVIAGAPLFPKRAT
jgi:methionyl-tRNA synthetase